MQVIELAEVSRVCTLRKWTIKSQMMESVKIFTSLSLTVEGWVMYVIRGLAVVDSTSHITTGCLMCIIVGYFFYLINNLLSGEAVLLCGKRSSILNAITEKG